VNRKICATALVPLLLLVLALAACGQRHTPGWESSEPDQIESLAVFCSWNAENAHRSRWNPNEIAGKGTGTCTNSNSALGGSVWVEAWATLQRKNSNGSWSDVAVQSPAVRKTIHPGSSFSWTNDELRVFTTCVTGSYRTVIRQKGSVWIQLGGPIYGSDLYISCN